MKRQLTLASALLLALTSAAAAAADSLKKDSDIDELLVIYKDGVDEEEMQGALQSARGKRMKTLRMGRARGQRVKVKPDELESAMKTLQQDPSVAHVQKNFRYRTTAVPNDPYYPQLWGLENKGQTITSNVKYSSTPRSTNNPGTAGKDMNLELAWNTTTDCSSTVVAVIDTGINYKHTDLVANLWSGGASYPNHGWDFIDGDNTPLDLHGHGTHVAGTIGAVGNNGLLGTGVCWNARLMAIRVLDASGVGTTADIIQGIDFAVARGAKILNMSLGGSSGGAAQDSLFSAAIQRALDAGVLIIAAAGNSGENVDSPGLASYPCAFTHANLICVAALDQKYAMASFSNYGTTSVDVGAPGVNTVSHWAGATTKQTELFNTAGIINWTTSSTTNTGWGYVRRAFSSLGSSLRSALVVPKIYDGSTQKYANNTTDRVYKAFSFASALSIVFDFHAFVDTEPTYDPFKISYRVGTTASPFEAGGQELDRMSGSSEGEAVNLAYELPGCGGQTCTVGFELQSDGSDARTGVAVLAAEFTILTEDLTAMNVISGTSMAAPHVAGAAALVWATNPQYTWREVADAIKSSGVAVTGLSGKTTTGKAVDAAAAVSYIRAPTSVQAISSP